MNFKKILLPTDFSHYNDAALEYASTLAAKAEAALYIVHVDELRDLNLSAAMAEAGYPYVSPWDTEDRREVRERLAKVVPTIAAVTYEHHYLSGSPVTEILRFAEREHVDLIVMASHGRTGVSRLLMGSIAEGVMRKASCPVLVVKQPAKEHVPAENTGPYVAHG